MNNLDSAANITSTVDDSQKASILNLISQMSIISNIISLIVLVIIIVAMWKIFSKSGEKGWKSLIPFYNTYVFYKIIWKKWVGILMICLPIFYVGLLLMSIGLTFSGGGMLVSIISLVSTILMLVLSVMTYYHLAKAFGYGVGMTIGLIFLNPIFICIIAFGNSIYFNNNLKPDTKEYNETTQILNDEQSKDNDSIDNYKNYDDKLDKYKNSNDYDDIEYYNNLTKKERKKLKKNMNKDITDSTPSIKPISYKKMKGEIKGYGFNYNLSTFIFQIICVLAAIVFVSYLYKLKIVYVIICGVVAVGSLPVVVLAQFKFLHNNQKFEDLVNYLDQMIMAFKQTPKILPAMKSTLEFLNGDLQKRVEEAIYIIENDSSSENVYKKAFALIERNYPCSRLKTLHRFLLNVETGSSTNYQDSIDNLYFDIRSWVTRTYQYQAELKNIKGKITIILGLSLGIAAVFSRILFSMQTQLKKDYNISLITHPVYQISTTIFVILFIIIFVFLMSKINGHWLVNDIDESRNEKIAKYMEYVASYDRSKNRTTAIIGSLICVPIPIVGYLLGNTTLLIGGLLVLAFVVFDKLTKFNRRKKVVERELIKEFPIWMRDIAINLNNMIVVRAIEESIPNASFVMKPFLKNFVKRIEEEPDSIKPYKEFLGIYDVSELSTAFKMLYGIKAISADEGQRQVNDLIDRNQTLLEQSEKTRNEDYLSGTTFISMIPMVLLSFKLNLDLAVMMLSFLSLGNGLGA